MALAGAAIFVWGKLGTGLALKKLKFYRPRVKFGRVSLTNIEMQITIDIENPGSSDVALDYFTGDMSLNGKPLSSFTFNGNNQTVIKARQVTPIPFTVVISNITALSTLLALVKQLAAGGSFKALVNVAGSIYAGGYSYDVAFAYDLKTNQVAGVGRMRGRGRKRRPQKSYPAHQPGESVYTDEQLPQPSPVNGIGTVKASLEFGSNSEMEKYFANKRMAKKIMFSKN